MLHSFHHEFLTTWIQTFKNNSIFKQKIKNTPDFRFVDYEIEFPKKNHLLLCKTTWSCCRVWQAPADKNIIQISQKLTLKPGFWMKKVFKWDNLECEDEYGDSVMEKKIIQSQRVICGCVSVLWNR